MGGGGLKEPGGEAVPPGRGLFLWVGGGGGGGGDRCEILTRVVFDVPRIKEFILNLYEYCNSETMSNAEKVSGRYSGRAKYA